MTKSGKKKIVISKNEDETAQEAEKLSRHLEKGGLLYLIGDLGSGKTLFSKFLANSLGIKSFFIKSPTYTYIRKYHLKSKKQYLYHIDLYRLEEIDDLLLNEIKEITDNERNIVVIEWADKLENLIPHPKIIINFKYLSEYSRELKIIHS